MSAVKYERLRELEVALALKSREIDVLRTKCDEYRSEQNGAFNNLVTKSLSSQKCDEALREIPLEQLQNAIAQLNATKNAEDKAAKILEKTAKEIELQVVEHEKEQEKLHKSIAQMTELTGLDEVRAKKRLEEIRKEDEKESEKRADEGYCDGEGGKTQVTPQSRTMAVAIRPLEIRVQDQQLTRELHAADVIRQKNDKAILALREAIEKRKQLREQRCEVLAQIKLAQRDMNEQRAILKSLVAEHEQLDKHAEAIRDRTDHSCRAILDKDSVTLRSRLEQCVERRRLQDRVIKAQQYRLNDLTNRVKVVQDALQRHGIAREVDLRIAEAEQAAAKSAGSSGTQLIQLPENEEEAYYDVDAIVPVEETIHPAIYSLFVQDKERLEKRVSLQGVMLQEKHETLEALEAKIADLQLDADAEADKLHALTIENEREITQLKKQTADRVLSHRQDYVNLVQRGRTVQAKVVKSRDEVAKTERRQAWVAK